MVHLPRGHVKSLFRLANGGLNLGHFDMAIRDATLFCYRHWDGLGGRKYIRFRGGKGGVILRWWHESCDGRGKNIIVERAHCRRNRDSRRSGRRRGAYDTMTTRSGLMNAMRVAYDTTTRGNRERVVRSASI